MGRGRRHLKVLGVGGIMGKTKKRGRGRRCITKHQRLIFSNYSPEVVVGGGAKSG